MIGFSITGSFCTLSKVPGMMEQILNHDKEILPIVSEIVQTTDTRFAVASEFIDSVEEITGHKIIRSIKEAEPIGPKSLLEAMVIAPCTGNTMAKMANGITDTCVTMACKAHLRNDKPLIIFLSTNDGLGANAQNMGILLNTKNVYFVPFRQDDPIKKCNSLVSYPELLWDTVKDALEGKQIQPVIR